MKTMRNLFALVLCFLMAFSMSVFAQATEETGSNEPARFVKVKIPFPEELADNDSWRTVARYADSGQAIPLSDAFGDYVYAIVPFENKDRKIEAFVPDSISFTDDTEFRYEFYVMENLSCVGVILGNEKGEALPFANVTRAEATAMIMRFLGISPAINPAIPFTDVSREDWFYGNVGALYEAGIVKGDSETTFSPGRNVSREEITVMVVRALQYADLRCPFRTEENIADKESVSSWAKEAYEYIGVNYVSDYEGEDTESPYRMLYPQKSATRYDIAYMLDNTLKTSQLFATDLAIKYGFDEKMPVIDGSTSTYPFTEEVYRALFVNATTHPGYPRSHSKSHVSYERLINGEVDMLFASVYPAGDILALAEEKGVELELIPIAYDAMIFFTNAKNPVDTLTKEQISEIYVNNKYKTWAELGGTDAKLYPYCRNNDSGSHAQMEKHFLNGNEIHSTIQAETISETMSNILTDVMDVPNQDKNGYGLGYSIYYYFNNMDRFYDTKTQLKLLAVDGVYPTDETISKGSYPLSNNTYIVLRKDTPEGHPARNMAKFMLTEAGQECVELAGYGRLY